MPLSKQLKIAAGCGGAAIFGILFGWVLFPTILKSQLKKVIAKKYAKKGKISSKFENYVDISSLPRSDE